MTFSEAYKPKVNTDLINTMVVVIGEIFKFLVANRLYQNDRKKYIYISIT